MTITHCVEWPPASSAPLRRFHGSAEHRCVTQTPSQVTPSFTRLCYGQYVVLALSSKDITWRTTDETWVSARCFDQQRGWREWSWVWLKVAKCMTGRGGGDGQGVTA